MDCDYLDFSRLYLMVQMGSNFVLCAKSNRSVSAKLLQTIGPQRQRHLRSDSQVCDANSIDKFPNLLRCISFQDVEHDKKLIFLTNKKELAARTIAEKY